MPRARNTTGFATCWKIKCPALQMSTRLSFDTLSLLLIDCGVTNALTRYLLSVDKPSAYGLKLELDRLRRKIENFISLHKGDADDFMRESKEWIEEWRAEAATRARCPDG